MGEHKGGVFNVCVITVSLEAPNAELYHCGLGGQALSVCHFNSLKIICDYDKEKANKVFNQKCFQYFKFDLKVSTFS